MSLIVEDGTNVPGAESYLSVADADTYFDSRGISLWGTMTTLEKEQALRRATDYMTGIYRQQWKGSRMKFDQALDWPRFGVQLDDVKPILPGLAYYGGFVPHNVVPVEVKNACAELAFRASGGPLNPDIQLTVTEETIGPITVKYDKDAHPNPIFAQIDATLAPFLSGGNGAGMHKVYRV